MNNDENPFTLEQTYKMHPSPPPAMSWEEYESRVTSEWTTLLNSEDGCDESKVHAFLVKHPCMIPGAYSVTGPSGHGPFPFAVLSESPLAGNGMRIPDFIWLAKDSANFTPVFVEIESPCKRWFTKQGVPSSDLTQAINQFAQWRAWLNRPENLSVFFESFEVPDYLRRSRNFRPEFVLIYGRRAEFDGFPEHARLREQFERHGQVAMTFDRLRPNRDSSIFLSATKRNGRYRALSVPATLKLGTISSHWIEYVDGVADAIKNNGWIDQARKNFLLERLPYWENWTKNGQRGITRGETE